MMTPKASQFIIPDKGLTHSLVTNRILTISRTTDDRYLKKTKQKQKQN